ncbi:MAG: hypothetical protein R3D55_00050 [Chloroflexota bacterium]
MFVPIGLLITLVIVAFLLGMVTVPLLVLVILKTPARQQVKPIPVSSQK